MTTLQSNGHWDFSYKIDINKVHGFVYIIKNTESKMMYIGKKIVKGGGKKNKGVESNWKSYTSSSKTINEDIQKNGKDNYNFYILDTYNTKGGLSWAETWSQCIVEVPSNNLVWYNRFIDKVSWRSSEHISKLHKTRLKKLTKEFNVVY